MNPWYFILGPLALCLLGFIVCKFGEAIDHWKRYDDPLDFIFAVLVTISYSSMLYGFYLLILKK